MSNALMYLLLAQCAFLAISCCYEKNWNLALYWVGATILNIGVIRMS